MGKYLLCGDTRSCGCIQREYRAHGNPKHGGAMNGKLTKEYKSWRDAKERCFNSHKATFKHYGGRGISMCDKWHHDFGAFLADMGACPPGHSLDRINNDGNYEPGNCRWATQQQQTNNQRRNIRVTWQGQTHTLKEVAGLAGVDYFSLYAFYHKRSHPIEVAVRLAKPLSA